MRWDCSNSSPKIIISPTGLALSTLSIDDESAVGNLPLKYVFIFKFIPQKNNYFSFFSSLAIITLLGIHLSNKLLRNRIGSHSVGIPLWARKCNIKKKLAIHWDVRIQNNNSQNHWNQARFSCRAIEMLVERELLTIEDQITFESFG